jgi:hypothetical protein
MASSEESRMKKVFQLVIFASILTIIIIVFILFAVPRVRYIAFDNEVRSAWINCNPEKAHNEYECYEAMAINLENPNICWLAGANQDDWCMQSVFEASSNPEICDRIPKDGVRELCRLYFR